MQDFIIYDEAKEIYLEPIEFCKGHSFDNPVIDYKDIPDFFKTCSEKIYLRSVKMIKELKIIEGI